MGRMEDGKWPPDQLPQHADPDDLEWGTGTIMALAPEGTITDAETTAASAPR